VKVAVAAADGSDAFHHRYSVELSHVQERLCVAWWCLAGRPWFKPGIT